MYVSSYERVYVSELYDCGYVSLEYQCVYDSIMYCKYDI